MATRRRESDGIMFGEKLAFSSRRKVDYAVSGDEKAFDLKLVPPLAAGVGSVALNGLAQTRSPISTRVYSAVIPATGKNVDTSFKAIGFGVTEPGTNTVLILTVNDQHSVTHFPPGQEEQDFVAWPLEYRAEEVTEVRLTLVVIAQRDSAHPEASAFIAVAALGADSFVPRNPTR